MSRIEFARFVAALPILILGDVCRTAGCVIAGVRLVGYPQDPLNTPVALPYVSSGRRIDL